MAEIQKKKVEDKYNTSKIKKTEIKKKEKEPKKAMKKEVTTNKKQNIFVRFRIFCHGVKSEFEKVHWTPKTDMIKYSIASIFFIVFCSLFFYLIDVLFALVQTIFA